MHAIVSWQRVNPGKVARAQMCRVSPTIKAGEKFGIPPSETRKIEPDLHTTPLLSSSPLVWGTAERGVAEKH
jgi:hypothetical protein